MAVPKKPKMKSVGTGPFDFASVALAAGSGRLSMGAFAAYLDALRAPTKRPRRSKSSAPKRQTSRHRA
jgi:hypothetical protein